MMMRLALSASVLAACRAAAPDAPAITSIEPPSTVEDRTTPIVIHGRNFFARVEATYDGADAADLGYRASIGTTPLSEVHWRGPEVIAAVVPAGIAPGTYDVLVHTPAGDSVGLRGGFTVLAAAAVDGAPSGDPGAGGDADAGATDPSATPTYSLQWVSAVPAALTADAADASELVLRVQDDAGAPITGRSLSFESSEGGSFGPLRDRRDGTYAVTFTAPANAGPGYTSLTAADGSGAGSSPLPIRLVPSCGGASFVVATADELEAAVSGSNAQPGRDEICIRRDVRLALQRTLSLGDPAGATLRAEARAVLDGAQLSALDVGVIAATDGNRLTRLTFDNFAGVALYLSGAGNSVDSSTFSGCDVAVVITGPGSIVGPDNDIARCTSAGIKLDADDAVVVGNHVHDHEAEAIAVGTIEPLSSGAAIRRNRLYRNARGIVAYDGEGLRVEHNTFAENGGDALLVMDEVVGVWVRNNIFDRNLGAAIRATDVALATPPTHNAVFENQGSCAGCTLGTGTVLADPRLTLEAYDLAADSPCVDAGMNVGEAYLGLAPDIGAHELR